MEYNRSTRGFGEGKTVGGMLDGSRGLVFGCLWSSEMIEEEVYIRQMGDAYLAERSETQTNYSGPD